MTDIPAVTTPARSSGHDNLLSGAARESRHPHHPQRNWSGQRVRVGPRVIWACVGSGIEHRGVARCLPEPYAVTDDTEVAMTRPLTGGGAADDPRRVDPGVDGRPVDVEERVVTKPARTSAAAAFALAFGVAAFVCVC